MEADIIIIVVIVVLVLYAAVKGMIRQVVSSHHRLMAGCCGPACSETSGATSCCFRWRRPSPDQHQHLWLPDCLCQQPQPDSPAHGSPALHSTPPAPRRSGRGTGRSDGSQNHLLLISLSYLVVFCTSRHICRLWLKLIYTSAEECSCEKAQHHSNIGLCSFDLWSL